MQRQLPLEIRLSMDTEVDVVNTPASTITCTTTTSTTTNSKNASEVSCKNREKRVAAEVPETMKKQKQAKMSSLFVKV